MNRPRQTRKLIVLADKSIVPARIGPNHHKCNQQPKGYHDQVVDDPRFNHALRRVPLAA